MTAVLDATAIRAQRAEAAQMRDRDFADQIGISEAQLVAAYCGHGVVRIEAHPDAVMDAAQHLGEVMALTRNPSCVHEKVGVYDNYHTGQHAAMVLTEDIDLRLFPSHWVHAFMVQKDGPKGMLRSLQVFDAAGDAVHKVFLRGDAALVTWGEMLKTRAVADQSDMLVVEARKPPEAPKSVPDKADKLRAEWTRMTDTHQFLRLTSRLKMNRLGAYRIAGAPFVRALAPTAVDTMLEKLQETGTEVMLFVGNRGCIQIHNGPIETLRPMGPWQNIT